MEKIKLYLILLFITFITVTIFAEDIDIENKINNVEGREKWELLEKFLIKQSKFTIPPSLEICFKENNLLLDLYYTPKQIIENKGFWKIDKEKKYIYIKLSKRKPVKYFSFKFDCIFAKEINKVCCNLILYKGKIFKEPKDNSELLGSEDYEVLGYQK